VAGETAGAEAIFDALLAQFQGGHLVASAALRGAGMLPDLLRGPAHGVVPDVVKRAFDFYFRDDLYGTQIHADPIILSSGSFDETVFGLPASLKDCVRYSMDMNWYGYSDSLGRSSARRALAQLETTRHSGTATFDEDNIAVVLGGTAAIASIVDMIAEDRKSSSPKAIVCVPNYPPLVAGVARRMPVELVPIPLVNGEVSIEPLLAALRDGPTLALVQTVINPWGLRISEDHVAELIGALPADCYLIIDECHDAFGPCVELTHTRQDPRVIAIRSLSKRWAAPGLKAGWLVAQKPLIDRFYSHASTTYGGPPSLLGLFLEMFALFETARWTGGDLATERAYLRAEYGLADHQWHRALHDYLDAADRLDQQVLVRRHFALDRLRDAGIAALAPDYSINMLLKMGNLPSYNLYRRLVTEAKVSVLPGLLTMATSEGTVRISPCLEESVLDEGLDRLVRWYLEHHA
jgi:aspartate/methionine/tyrosine aminotransferase